jgi:hypothetical protein
LAARLLRLIDEGFCSRAHASSRSARMAVR